MRKISALILTMFVMSSGIAHAQSLCEKVKPRMEIYYARHYGEMIYYLVQSGAVGYNVNLWLNETRDSFSDMYITATLNFLRPEYETDKMAICRGTASYSVQVNFLTLASQMVSDSERQAYLINELSPYLYGQLNNRSEDIKFSVEMISDDDFVYQIDKQPSKQ